MKNRIDVLADELRNRADRLDAISRVYSSIEQAMKYDAMAWTDETDENGDTIYTAPGEDDWRYVNYKVWKEVLEAVIKLAEKK